MKAKTGIKHTNENREKTTILLGLLPYWTPMIPPMAVAYLKGYLQPRGYDVTTFDLNIEMPFKELYNRYFDTLKSFIPVNKRGNFYNIGHDLLQNHMAAHMHREYGVDYIQLVRKLVYETYFCTLDDEQIHVINSIWDEFYTLLEEHLNNLLDEVKPDVFGLTAYVHTFPASLFAFKLAKKKNPAIKTVMGGGIFIWQFPVGSSEFNYLLERTEDYLDKIIVGEGQQILYKYLEGELDDSKRVYTLADVGGRALEVDSVGLPDYSGLKMDFYPYIATFGSRSCPNQCSFCTVSRFHGEYIQKEAAQIVSEIMELRKAHHGRQLFFMVDSLVNRILPELTPELAKSETAIYYDGYLRVDDAVCDIENTLQWRRGGFYRARIGAESGSQRVLDLIDKRITLDQTRAALTSLAQAGIKTTTFWIVGHPGETEEEFQMTLDFIEELKDYIYEAEFNPFFYFYDNQTKGDEWAEKRYLLYPESARPMLISQTWALDLEPSREETYSRLNRFIHHCKKLGIPNPYTMNEIQMADERWKRLHRNAAPSLVELEDTNVYIDDRHTVQKLVSVSKPKIEEATFGF